MNKNPYPSNVKTAKTNSKKYHELVKYKKNSDMINRLNTLLKSGELTTPKSKSQKSTSSIQYSKIPLVDEAKTKQLKKSKMVVASAGWSTSPLKQTFDVDESIPNVSGGQDDASEVISISSGDQDDDDDDEAVYTHSLSRHAKQTKKKPTLRDQNIEREQAGTRRRLHAHSKDKNQPPGKKRGSGMSSNDLIRFDRNEHVSYTYWDNANELIDRLRLLISSQSAGNTGHTNEIVSIIEELRESNIIR